MKLKKYIAVAPMVELSLDLLRFGKNRYTWASFWDDLRGLDSRCIFNKFKIFIDQEDPAFFPPKLFVCMLISAESIEEAYEKCIQDILALSNGLVSLFSKGFEPIYHEMIIIPLYSIAPPPMTKDAISVKLVELTIKNGNVDTIITPYGVWRHVRTRGEASHKEYLDAYFNIPKIEAGNIPMPDIRMLKKEALLNLEHRLKKTGTFESNTKAKLVNLVASLYSAAVTTENISVSYLLLWQILESSTSSKEAGRKSLNKTTLNSIKGLLQEEKYDNATVQKVNSVLGGLRDEVEMIAEMLRKYLFPDDGVDVLEQKVEKFRKIRGAITHPRPSRRLDTNELLTNYKELRDIINKLLWKLGNSNHQK